MLRDAWRLIRTALPERRSRLAGLIALGVASALAEGAGLMLLVVIINRLPGGGAGGGLQLEQAILVYIAIVAAAAVTVWARTLQTARLRLETADRLRREAFEAILMASWPALRRMPAPTVTQLVTIEASRVGMGIDYLMNGIAIATRVPVLFAVAFRLSPVLATLTLAAAAALAFVSFRSDRLARQSGERMIATGRATQTRIVEALLGRRVVKAFGLERARIDAFAEALDDTRAAQLAQQRAFAGARAMLGFLVAAATAVVLWLAVRVMGLDLGSALIFAAAYGRLGQSVLALRTSRQIVLAALPAEAAVRTLVGEARAAAEPASTERIALPRREIAIRGVSLEYEDGTKALDDVSAVIPVGAVTAIVGPSGAGKSTLADLVMGLAVPTRGSIALDDATLDAAGRLAWRRHVGYVPQDAFLFHESIRDNLLAARPAATGDEIWSALEAADAAALVRALPEGLETIAGERGTRLSGGEAQRIALARALLRHPALLVLDEPTSALDGESESRIIATLERLRGRHTIVIVAHRQALAAIADHVIALDRGRVRRF
jgi:ATP-binding cassette, subfamily C, bacterial